MKYLLFSLLSVFFISLAARDKVPNLIVIETIETPDEARREMGRILFEKGFLLEEIDPAYNMILTRLRENRLGIVSATAYKMRIKVLFDRRDSITYINLSARATFSRLTGPVTEENFDDEAIDIKMSDNLGNLHGHVWQILVDIAREYPRGEKYRSIQ